MITHLPCAICSNPIEAMDGDDRVPYGANIFTSSGHYGSTVYDSFHGEHLEILICAECLLALTESRVVMRVLHSTRNTPEQRNIFRSDEDPYGDNPLNSLRLENELAMNKYLESTSGMTKEWATEIFNACEKASKEGISFSPEDIPAP